MKTYYAIKNKRYVATECESFQELFNELWDNFVLSHTFEDGEDEAEVMQALEGKLESDIEYVYVIQNLDDEIDILEKEDDEDEYDTEFGEDDFDEDEYDEDDFNETDEYDDDVDIELADDDGLFHGAMWQSHRDGYIVHTISGYLKSMRCGNTAERERNELLMLSFVNGLNAVIWTGQPFRYLEGERCVECIIKEKNFSDAFDVFEINEKGCEHIAVTRLIDGDMPYDKIFYDDNGYSLGFCHATGWERNFGDGWLVEYLDRNGVYHYCVAD